MLRNSKIDTYYLLAYLNSEYGKHCLLRRQRGAVQTGLNKDDLKTVPIPIFSSDSEKKIGRTVKKALTLTTQSEHMYFQAQKIIEQELGLDNLSLDKSVGYETKLSEILSAFRMDAQCYNPDFLSYEKYLKKNTTYTMLRHLISSMNKGKQMPITSSGSMPYVSIKDIDGIELVAESHCFPTKETQIATNENLLLAITGATIGKIGIINQYKKIAFSGDLLNLEISNDINPYYLLAVMQSPIGQSQCSRWITGSTNGHLAPKDVGKIVIPRLEKKIEDSISQKVIESLNLKKESKQLLEQAKQMVVGLIEQAAGNHER